jgi:chloramphenicol 3-O phosphotransferase
MNKFLIILLIICLVLISFFIWRHMYARESKSGTIIILNGPSGSGKSTIQRGIQETFDDLYLKIGIDNFFDMILPDIDAQGQSIEKSSHELIRSIETTHDADGNPVIALKVGPLGQHIIKGMHRALAAYASQNNNIAMDYIVYDQSWIADLVNTLKDFKVYFIGIHIPLEVLEEREQKRDTSPIGHARSHYDTVHKNMIYDLELNTATMNPEQCVSTIKDFIQANPNPHALQKLLDRYG